MLNLISVVSLIVMISSLFFAIISKRINLPIWYEVISWIFILGAISLLLNGLFDPPYVENTVAEIILRFFGAILVLGGVVYAYSKSGVRHAKNTKH